MSMGQTMMDLRFLKMFRKNLMILSASLLFGEEISIVYKILRTLDKKGGPAHTHVNSQERIQNIMGAYDLVDIWRRKIPNVFRYTWHSSSNPPVQCRLDYFLVSFRRWRT